MTGRSKSHPDATLDPRAGSSARDRPGILPLAPRNKDQSAKFLQSEDIFVKQLVAVSRVRVCADAAKNDYLALRNHCVQGVRGNVPIFDVRAASRLKFCAHSSLQSFSTSDKMKGPKTGLPGGTTFDPKRVHFWVPSEIYLLCARDQNWALSILNLVPPWELV